MRQPIQVDESGSQVPAGRDDTLYQTPPVPSEPLDRALLPDSPVDLLPDLFPRLLVTDESNGI